MYTHTHNRVLCSYKKFLIFPFATTWVNLGRGGIMLGEKELNKDKYHTISIMYGILKKVYVIKTENKNGSCQGLKGGGNGKMLVKV